MRGKGLASGLRKGQENAKPDLQGKDPKTKNALEKLSGQAFIRVLSDWISEQFQVAFVLSELQCSLGM